MPRAKTKSGPAIEITPKPSARQPPGKHTPPTSWAKQIQKDRQPIESDEPDQEGEDDAGGFSIDPNDARKNPRAERLPEGEFWGFMEQWPTPDDLIVYVYRLEPVIKRKAQGLRARPITYINKVAGRITRQWLLQNRGSGLYNVRMTDQGKTGKATRQVCMTNVAINEWDKWPPVIDDPTELVDCEANRSFIAGLIAQKELARDGEGKLMSYNDKQSQDRNNADPTNQTRTALEFVERMSSKQNQPSKVEEHAAIKIVDTMAAMLAKSQDAKSGGADYMPLILAMMQQSQEQSRQQSDFMLKMMLELNKRPAEQHQRESPTSTLRETAEVMKIISEMKPSTAGPDPVWLSVLEKLAPALVPMVAAASQKLMSTPQANAPQQQAQVQPPPIHETHIPQGIPVAGVPLAAAAGIPVQEATPQQPSPAQPPDQSEIRQIGMMAAQFMANGASGQDLAGAITGAYGVLNYNRVAQTGPTLIKLGLQSDPEVWKALSMFPQLDEFIAEFIDYGKPEEGEPQQ